MHRSITSKRLNCIPGVGPLLATALSRASPTLASSDLVTILGLIGLLPKRHSSEVGQSRLSANRGSLFARPVRGRRTRRHPLCQDPRASIGPGRSIAARRPTNRAIAFANKSPEWPALMASGERYVYPAGLTSNEIGRITGVMLRSRGRTARNAEPSIRRSGQPTRAIACSSRFFTVLPRGYGQAIAQHTSAPHSGARHLRKILIWTIIL